MNRVMQERLWDPWRINGKLFWRILRKLHFKYFFTHEFKNKLKESFQGTALIHSPSAYVAAIPPFWPISNFVWGFMWKTLLWRTQCLFMLYALCILKIQMEQFGCFGQKQRVWRRLCVAGSVWQALCERLCVKGSVWKALCERLRVAGSVWKALCERLFVGTALQ